MTVLLLFFCSGATALVYEVVWSKYLELLFGSTIQAQSVVLAAFMGGLALGNKWFGRYADRVRRPLVIYGGIEIVTGLYAFFFPSIYRLTDGFFAVVGSRLLDQSIPLLLLKGLLSAALLLGPTILMGGTLPLLAAWLQRHTLDAGRRSARFYSTNSLGAVVGAALAGFVLVERLGLPTTMTVTALANVIVGLIAVGIGRRTAALPAIEPETAETAGSKVAPQENQTLFRWGCLLVALTGGVSMGLEVLASRCLALILGASLQVFAIVLMAFILGIGLGSAVIASPRRKHWSQENTTIVLLIAAAGLIGLLVFNIENLTLIYSKAQMGLTRTLIGYRYHEVLVSVIAICVLGLPAAALGSVLPLWIRTSEASHALGGRVGRLLTWNTLGAVGGVLVTGFFLMPGIGLRGAFMVLAWVLAAGALITALASRRVVGSLAGVGLALLLTFVSVRGGEGWRYALSAGVFRLPNGVYSRAFEQERRQTTKLLFYEDAADATVSVEGVSIPGRSEILSLRINGKVDASVPGDMSTQVLLGQLPLIMKPDSKDAFVIGLGSGVSAGTALGYPIEQLTVAENCAPVIRALDQFAAWNHGVRTNSRAHIYCEDGRTVMKLSPQKYDVVISAPSNPWTVGIGSVFSRDFYELVASRLKPGGIMAQWFQTYEVDDEVMELVVRTFGSVFPIMEIWDVGKGDVVLLGADRPWKSDPDVYRHAFDLAAPRRDLAAIGLTSPVELLARQLASQQTAFAVPGPGPLQTDAHPILEYAAPRTFYIYLGGGCERFQNFDERTLQMDLAPPGKNEALKQLSWGQVQQIFGGIAPSVNHALQARLKLQGAGAADPAQLALLTMPFVFQGTNTALLFMPDIARTNAIAYQLFNAEAVLKTNPTNQLAAVMSIQQTLNMPEVNHLRAPRWSAAYYAKMAVKASVRLGEGELAKALLLRGMQLDPDSEELQYLSRILIHKGMLQPADLRQASVR